MKRVNRKKNLCGLIYNKMRLEIMMLYNLNIEIKYCAILVKDVLVTAN